VSEDEEIKVLMVREIVEDICGSVDDRERGKCRAILHRILVAGEGLEALSELSMDSRRIIKDRLRDLGVE